MSYFLTFGRFLFVSYDVISIAVSSERCNCFVDRSGTWRRNWLWPVSMSCQNILLERTMTKRDIYGITSTAFLASTQKYARKDANYNVTAVIVITVELITIEKIWIKYINNEAKYNICLRVGLAQTHYGSRNAQTIIPLITFHRCESRSVTLCQCINHDG